ncbi:hypothetical protein [Nocardia alni]|uniref:hypothetical protein n=1 Tax=Nocardia alni TaxID=2815723 RepID=UPI0020B1DBA1|nr:hypothetical protein [Nocardia alni]
MIRARPRARISDPGRVHSAVVAYRCHRCATTPHFALNGTDHRSYDEQNAAIGAYIRWHNTRIKPKTNFAPE